MNKFVELAFVAYQSIVLIHQQSSFLLGNQLKINYNDEFFIMVMDSIIVINLLDFLIMGSE